VTSPSERLDAARSGRPGRESSLNFLCKSLSPGRQAALDIVPIEGCRKRGPAASLWGPSVALNLLRGAPGSGGRLASALRRYVSVFRPPMGCPLFSLSNRCSSASISRSVGIRTLTFRITLRPTRRRPFDSGRSIPCWRSARLRRRAAGRHRCSGCAAPSASTCDRRTRSQFAATARA